MSLADRTREIYDAIPIWGKAIITAGVSIGFYVYYKKATSRPRKTPYKENYEKDVVYLYQFVRNSATPNFSPYCLKLETWLRIADIPYKNVENLPFSLKSREGTMPFVEVNGVEYVDSSLIIKDLTKLFHKEQLESFLSDEQRAAARAFEHLAEYSLLWCNVKYKLPHYEQIFKLYPPNLLPAVLKLLYPFFARSLKAATNQKILAMGIGRHSDEDIIRISEDDLSALSNFLGTKHYLTGFKATRVDATVFAVVANIIYMPFETPQRKLIDEKYPNLREYCERIKHRYWPDWDECTAKFTMSSDWKKKI